MNVVYAIINNENGKKYIGSSCEYAKRVDRHIRDLNKNCHHCKRLQKSWNKYGEINFTFKLIKSYSDRKITFKKEEKYIKKYLEKGLLFNSSLTGIAGDLLENHPDKEKLIKKRIKKFKEWMKSLSESERKEIYGKKGKLNGMYGKTHTLKVKKKLSKLQKGNTYALGSKRTTEHRKKLSELAKERKGELNPFYGKSHSKETKKKLSEANKGKLPINTQKVKIGNKIYKSMSSAARKIGCTTSTIINRINSRNEKFSHYQYVN